MRAALVILDGWGLGVGDEHGPDEGGRDAVAAADTPVVDGYRERGAFGTLGTHGEWVGLPDGQMGNSEVGHLTIGAGRTVEQDATRIDAAVAGDGLGANETIAGAFEHARENGGRVHVVGLVSDGGVHSMQTHLHALVRAAADADVEAVTHAFTDGRDTPPTGGTGYLRELETVAEDAGTGHVATVTGRYYAMDRDENWERTRRAYDAIVDREAPHEADSAVEAAEAAYERGETDEFVEPTLVDGGSALEDRDSVLFVNFRADRARQLVRMLADIRPDWDGETTPPETRLVTMTEYDETFDLPVAFPPRRPKHTLGEIVADEGWTQGRLAETEKYAHVTYFLNGGREVEFDGEMRDIVPSPDVPTYDETPAMSAPEVTDAALAMVEASDPDLLVLNYANPDMVGHTGDFDAATTACEAVDEQVGRLVPALLDAGASVLLTADHGNADDMGTAENPHTAHTLNPVPVVLLTPGDGSGVPGDGGYSIREDAGLAALSPTLLELVGLDQPDEMTGESLLE
ncbi:2,3-bisphosphoglycerate-independent phosphoglycerate mutase [Halomarina oriensis]|uniref:2,3-bisphosphoglycerate-independent phosphoglycerate mutase n=1 Tax=Halomarina oriensis TaxID=671145 RepID=A0A6B0GJY2_9EURY|nr:2,3-bisphosphoglycerate-independent phosphoglycerate mutase [Halomarina oriensis]MWG35124.1 2,3-bisphosphoglycerate-independent phosphoglycerate mutase [Halomarina oriensis]